MIGYTLTYEKPPSGQPEIMFLAGSKVVKISTGKPVQMAGTAKDFAKLPPGVTARPTTKAKAATAGPASTKEPAAAPHSTMTKPARAGSRPAKDKE